MIMEEFNEYMKKFKNLDLKEKQEIALEQLKLLLGLAQKMCEVEKVESELLVNRELLDTEKKEYTEDDFVESVVVYINSIQNLLCDYNLK